MDSAKKGKDLQTLWRNSAFAGSNAAYLEDLYEDFLSDPGSVSEYWQEQFQQLHTEGEQSHRTIRDNLRGIAHIQRPSATVTTGSHDFHYQRKQVRVMQLINAYRFRGHLKAQINPLEDRRPFWPLPRYELSDQDLDTIFETGTLIGVEKTSLRNIIDILNKTYCHSVGSEYMHISNATEKRWIQHRLEKDRCTPQFSSERKLALLKSLTAAEGLERYLHTKYVGQKRFSLEGAEALIPMLDEIIQRGGKSKVKEIAIGMAHRGRLNVLVNIMGKTPTELFSEFEGTAQTNANRSGDVKYHQGFSSNVKTSDGPIHVALSFNPSHLEIVGPVVEGSVRARQDRRGDKKGNDVIPVIIHGDAAFAGQGVVMETFNMSQSRGYSTKGTVHIVINNQIGFTTSNQRDARSTLYCTDVAKMVNAPILHVNGDDPEAVIFVTQLALDYRMNFHKDVVIDLVCYRRHGHNEADEPWATQPLMYKTIKAKPTTRALYAQQLVDEHLIPGDADKDLVNEYRTCLELGESVVDNIYERKKFQYAYAREWTPYLGHTYDSDINTGVDLNLLRQLGEKITHIPERVSLHTSVKKIYQNRRDMLAGKKPVDWGCAETLAYASLLNEQFNVRLTGQDTGRGTFFHRHVALHDQNDGKVYIPLRKLGPDHGTFLVINSLLSEEAVLAFEYGYASTDPRTLNIWEAQFGDFANTAQVVVDQFISAGEQKWERLCGLVMLLPHGYEGQGPEHSSARVERYLQLCAEHNVQVCMPTSAAQIFHLLRRQMLMACRKPLIVMTPKSLLRHKLASCDLESLTRGQFQEIIPEIDELDDERIKRVVMCSGKIYYDLLEKRRERERNDVAIIRMEQLYPFPDKAMAKQLNRYINAKEFIWCQEEPKNQGSWFTSQHHVRALLGKQHYLEYAGRPFSAAPAVGNMAKHVQQLTQLIEKALGPA
ncbi:MAG: 2-oxoglutarate dehydrogenase E1 component [Gammaproteobacteria bacterium]|nr:2-oxoglutarate dehydrogenase E1 component [Gammaproteobacteria bacterium]MDH5730895.1 2-oxoglutarate dehydrogenase E1 component [Gammaproteobacteria bacterium]